MTRKRQPRGRSVKCHYNYTVDEAAQSLGVHKGTVRRWIKEGLPAITDRKPTLILGDDLNDWLKARRANRQKCAPDELFCFKCRAPRRTVDRRVAFAPVEHGGGNLKAVCATCGTGMNRRIGAAQVADARRHFNFADGLAQPDITERIEPSGNVHLPEGSDDHA